MLEEAAQGCRMLEEAAPQRLVGPGRAFPSRLQRSVRGRDSGRRSRARSLPFARVRACACGVGFKAPLPQSVLKLYCVPL